MQDRLCTVPGILHGGAIMAFADTLGAVGTVLNLKPGESTTTIEPKTNFLSAGKGGTTVEGERTLLHRGRRTMVWQTRVTSPDGKLIAAVTQTQAVLEAPQEPSDTLTAFRHRTILRAALESGARSRGVCGMKIATFTQGARRRIGVVEGSEVCDVIGLNYAGHVAETGRDKPQFPVFFNKQTSSVAGPYDPIHRPRVSTALDYEGELAFVIGKRCRHVPKERAHEVIAGYLIGHDVSVRDWQFKAQTMTLGKSFDTHGPLGPWLTTPDEVGDPHALELRTFVNGEQRQHARTSELIHDCFDQVAVLSTVCTLEPGDVISTGTPDGVGAAMKPPQWLVPGDVVRIEIEQLGHLENLVVEEPDDTTTY